MKLEQRHWTVGKGWTPAGPELAGAADLVFVIGETSLLKQINLLDQIQGV